MNLNRDNTSFLKKSVFPVIVMTVIMPLFGTARHVSVNLLICPLYVCLLICLAYIPVPLCLLYSFHPPVKLKKKTNNKINNREHPFAHDSMSRPSLCLCLQLLPHLASTRLSNNLP